MIQNKTSNELACIRRGTEQDLADATALALRILAKTQSTMDYYTFEFSQELFTAVSLHVAYTKENSTFKDMLDFLVDPGWDSDKQMLTYFGDCTKSFGQKESAIWIKGFVKKVWRLSDVTAASMVKRCHSQWQAALGSSKNMMKKPRGSVHVFNLEAVSEAMASMCEAKEENRVSCDRVLGGAALNNGYRAIPNARIAGLKLEQAKSRFENLVEPISRLQIDLTLAAAMNPENFRITPILLLGEPGIGKTYLATQLAKALGVPTEKISAGGAQGGFQLTGSHSSWQRSKPGSIVTMLAEGRSTSPVIVIDEVDKISDSQYPILPVLLDLFEPYTARNFKDEFLEMEFDASRIIFVLTANSLDNVPTPLLSRVEVFDVPRPEPAQRLRIIQTEAKQLRSKTKKSIELDKDSSEILANRTDLDLRKTTRLVREAFAKALSSGETVAKLIIPKKEGRNRIGF